MARHHVPIAGHEYGVGLVERCRSPSQSVMTSAAMPTAPPRGVMVRWLGCHDDGGAPLSSQAKANRFHGRNATGDAHTTLHPPSEAGRFNVGVPEGLGAGNLLTVKTPSYCGGRKQMIQMPLAQVKVPATVQTRWSWRALPLLLRREVTP